MATRGYYNAHTGTQLGGNPFNHSQSSETEAEYDRLRDQARHEHGQMESCFAKSKEAYSSGDGASAKSLSEEGKRHQANAAQYNKQASEYIFRANNSPEHIASDTIDLHGQYVEEAEDILEVRIREAKARGQDHLHVIVGKGIHSPGHVQKIKPRVEEVCRELGLQFNTEPNAGRIFINLQGGPAPMAAAGQGSSEGGYQHGVQPQQGYMPQMSYSAPGGYGGQSAQQQYNGTFPAQNQSAYGKPQQQFDQEAQQEQQLEAALTTCLKKCCIVM